jgi:regulator of replication initiation timing
MNTLSGYQMVKDMCQQMTAMINERDAARAEVDSLQAQLTDMPRRSVRVGNDSTLDVTGIVDTLDRNNAQLESRMTEIAQLRNELAVATEKSLK